MKDTILIQNAQTSAEFSPATALVSVTVFAQMFLYRRSGSPVCRTLVPRNRLGNTVGHTKANEARRMLTAEHDKFDQV